MYFEDNGITYKIYWTLYTKVTQDGYFYKTIKFHEGHEYCVDYWEAKEKLDSINKSILNLGLQDLAKTGIIEE